VRAFAFAFLCGCGASAPAAGPVAAMPATAAPWAPTSVADPEFLAMSAKTMGFTLGRPSAIQPTPEGDAILFLRSGPESFERDLYVFDVATKRERVLLTAQQILQGSEERLTAEERARRERMRMTARGIASYSLSEDGRRILVPLSGRLFVVERTTGQVKELAGAESFPIDARFSPDGAKVSCVRDGDLYVTDVAAGAETRLTTTAGGTIENGLAEFVAQEEMGRMQGYWWSPDSRSIAYQETDTAGVETLRVLDPTHPESAPHDSAYPRVGKANAKVRLGVLPAAGGETKWVSWNAERYPYLAKVVWEEEAAPLTILVQDRRQTEGILFAVDPATGGTSPLLTERDAAWLNIDTDVPQWLPDGRQFLWTTERGGAWQLELRARDGSLVRAVTPPDFGYRGLSHVDETGRLAYVVGSPEPTAAHVWRVGLDEGGPAPERLTKAGGEHGAIFSDDHRTWVHLSATKRGPERAIVKRTDGGRIGILRSAAARPSFQPNLEWTTVGERQFRAVVVRPRNFEAGRRYPVVVAVYGGPHARVVTSIPRHFLMEQWIADHGFVVVSVDGRGTPDRGREWERAIVGDLGEIPLEDQVEGLQALGARYPEMDLSRVGIFGWSFGGYMSALAVMRRPDVFHVGVAGAPVADWRDYDTHYTERYMGLLEQSAQGYDHASLLSYASQLSRPLLVLHGTVDDNVLFLHSVRLSDALFRAGKEHEFLPLSGFTHMVPDPLIITRLNERIVGFLQRNLVGR